AKGMRGARPAVGGRAGRAEWRARPARRGGNRVARREVETRTIASRRESSRADGIAVVGVSVEVRVGDRAEESLGSELGAAAAPAWSRRTRLQPHRRSRVRGRDVRACLLSPRIQPPPWKWKI